MADDQTFQVLVSEFRRVGVDPDTFSAMIAVRPEDALRALRDLPDKAGATEFLARLRQQISEDAGGHAPDSPGSAHHGRAQASPEQRRNRSA